MTKRRVVCARASTPEVQRLAVEGMQKRKCPKCQEEVLISPSSIEVLDADPDNEFICDVCSGHEDPSKDTHGIAMAHYVFGRLKGMNDHQGACFVVDRSCNTVCPKCEAKMMLLQEEFYGEDRHTGKA